MNGIGPRWVRIATAAAVLAAVLLRLNDLDHRPMHTDEAVHAAKLGRLLDQGIYRYDPSEYHGPTLNYLTWPMAAFRGQHRYVDLDEVTLRLVPALFGLGLVLLPWICRKGLGRKATVLAVAFTAVSPAFVFYSRYYIQEVPLVFFTFGLIVCGWRYIHDRKPGWAVMAGVCAGLMHATNETAVIAWACLILAWILTWLWSGQSPAGIRPIHAGGAVLAAILVSFLFYSSFLTHPPGIVDSFRPFSTYLERAGAGGHVHPWAYYLDLLTGIPSLKRPGWNEDFTVLLAAAGLVWVMRRPMRTCNPWLARFLALYTLAMTVVYSAIPYKTPWCMLGFLHGMILLSALAVAEMIQGLAARWAKVLWLVVIGFGVANPMAQAYLLNTRYDSVPSNPYVYAHTSRDILTVSDRARAVAAVHPKGKALYVQVVCPEADYWPLPWYLRDFTSVGYWSRVDFNSPPGDVILAQPPIEPDVIELLYERPPHGSRSLYMPLLPPGTRLRPGVELRGYVRKDLWDALPDAER